LQSFPRHYVLLSVPILLQMHPPFLPSTIVKSLSLWYIGVMIYHIRYIIRHERLKSNTAMIIFNSMP
jgi:hypothetical protein